MKFTITFSFLFFYLIVCCFSQSTFSEKKYLFDKVPNNRAILLLDVDNDGDNDLVCSDNDKIFWRENRAGSFYEFDYRTGEGVLLNFSEEPTNYFFETIVLKTYDLNNDNYNDIILTTKDSIYVLLNNQNGSFRYTYQIDVLEKYEILDLNNDNYPDLSGLVNDKLVWQLNHGDGTFSTFDTISNTAFTLCSKVDLDEDGYIDFIGHSNDTTVWIMNNGDNTFADEENIYNSPIQSVKIIDFDNDNDLDILAISSNQDTLIFLENQNLNFHHNALIYRENFYAFHVLDLIDNDGNLDILINYYGSFYTYKNNGNNSFALNQSVSEYGEFNFADLDNDGDLDIVIGHDEITYFENDGNGYFNEGVKILDYQFSFQNSSADITILDINSDSLLDISLYFDPSSDGSCYRSNSGRKTYLNNGNLEFSLHQNYYKPFFLKSFQFDDLNSDGIMEEIYVDNGVLRIIPLTDFLPGEELPFFQTTIGQHFYKDNITHFELDDLNNDGFDDVIANTDYSHLNYLLLQSLELSALRWFENSTQNTINSPNNGASTQEIYEECEWNAMTLSDEIKDLIIVDLDGDGINDVLFESHEGEYCHNSGRYRLGWMKNYQDGQFSAIDSCQDLTTVIDSIYFFYNPSIIPLISSDNSSARSKVVYIDTDSFPDIITLANNDIIFMINNGNGTFVSDTVDNFHFNIASITSGDIDGDGDNDFICSCYSTDSKIQWLENDGNGNIINTHEITLGLSRNIKTAYINDDNLIDIYYRIQGTRNIKILYNDANHNFDSSALLSYEGDLKQIKLADIDYNGRIDILVTTSWPYQLTAFEQISNGVFEEHLIIDSLNDIADLKLGDINGDNLIDIVVANKEDILFYFENQTIIDTTDTVTAIQQNSLVDLNASIYPNPFTEQATLSFKDGKSKNYAIEITDIAGRLVQQFKSKGSNEIILKRGVLTNGIYFLNIYDEVNHLFLTSLKLVVD